MDDAASVASRFLLIQAEPSAAVTSKLSTAFPPDLYQWRTVQGEEPLDFPCESIVITYLGDETLVHVVAEASRRGWRLGALPHPQMKHMRLGFGIASRIDDAIADIKASERAATAGEVDAEAVGKGPERTSGDQIDSNIKPQSVDLMWCNGRPVMNSVVIGYAANLLLGGDRTVGWWTRITRFLFELRRLGGIAPAALDITTQKEKSLATAAIGMVVVEHGTNTLLARRVLEESSIKDGMLHALVLAPQSWLELFGFLFESLIWSPSQSNRLPAFAGHIKTSGLTVSSDREMPYVIDGHAFRAKELAFEVQPGALTIYPGRHLRLISDVGSSKEVYRIQSLPSQTARTDLILKPLPLLRHAATEDFKDLFLILRENSRTSPSFLTLMVLSSLLAACGLYANSGPVIIGAMILAPLMAPIISLAMALSRQDQGLLWTSLMTVCRGLFVAIGCAATASVVLPLRTITPEIEARLSPNLIDLAVAILSGVAGAYAHARQEVARSLAGVAIAVALVPPLVVAGIGLGWMEGRVFGGALLLFMTNLIGILFAASITFSLLGFSPLSRATRGLKISIVMVAIICIPLGISFANVVQAQRTARQIEGMRVGDIEVRDVTASMIGGVKRIRCKLIGDGVIAPEDCDIACQEIRRLVGEATIVESTVIYRLP